MRLLQRLLLVCCLAAPAGTASFAQGPPLAVSLSDAIDRALRYNLSVLSGTQEERALAAERLKALRELYPKFNAEIASAQQQINLASVGFGGFPGISQIVGPFALVDARARVSQSVIDRKLVYDVREAKENQAAAVYANENSRETVVLAVANIYLQTLSASARVTAVEAQVARARTLFDRASDLKSAGIVPGIDVLRAQVELQTQQQRLVQFRNDFALLKLNLARAAGIPLAQDIVLTDRMPEDTPEAMAIEDALQSARDNRSDVKRADALVAAAQHALDSAKAQSLPTLAFDADYGVIGRTPGQSHGTYTMRGELRIPIFNGNEGESDRAEAAARLEQRKLEAEDLKAQVEMEVRASFLQLTSAQEQVQVARTALDLVRTQLDQAQDRFEAGVVGNLEVVQAQEAVALADENIISSLYALNVAKARLARATGTAERTIKAFLGGRP